MPFIAYLSQTLNKNNKHNNITLSSLSCATKTNTHQHSLTKGFHQRLTSAYKVCAFLLNKMLASTIQLSTSNALPGRTQQRRPARTTPSSAHTERLQAKGARDNHVCDSSGPNSVSRPDQLQETSGSTPTSEEESSTEKHTRQPAGVSSTIPLASSTITTQPNAV